MIKVGKIAWKKKKEIYNAKESKIINFFFFLVFLLISAYTVSFFSIGIYLVWGS